MKKNSPAKYLIYTYLTFSLFHTIIGNKDNLVFLRLAQSVGAVIFIFVILSIYSSKSSKNYKLPIVILGCAVLGSIVNQTYYGTYYFLNLIYPIMFFGLGILTEKTHVKFKNLNIFTVLVLIYFIICIVQNKDPNFWVKGSSNQISVIGISILSILCFVSDDSKTQKYILWIHSLILMFICIYVQGRSGIISSFLLFCTISWTLTKNVYIKYFICIGLVLCLSGYLISNFDHILANYFQKFDEKGLEAEGRELIFEWYYQRINLTTIFTGVDTVVLQTHYDLSLHNSFLGLHSRYGIFSLGILCLCLKSYKKFILQKNYYYLGVMSVILLRSFTDDVLLSNGVLLGFPFMLCIVKVNDNTKYSIK